VTRSRSQPRASIDDLDPIIHAPKRLAVMAILANSTSTDFGFLRDHLGVTDSDLSKQMSTLDRAGFVEVIKPGRGRGSITSYRITAAGRRAFEQHLAVLNQIVAQTAVQPADQQERHQGRLEERPEGSAGRAARS
jgi:DNA-binding MarR family transcriptional regulator